VIEERLEDGTRNTFAYDSWGNVTQKVVAAGTADELKTSFLYDDIDRVTNITILLQPRPRCMH
jgi:YD repeat-containing protein